MKQYEVTISRTYYATDYITVTAETEEQARQLACREIDEPVDYTFGDLEIEITKEIQA